jgi:hypothetical protein
MSADPVEAMKAKLQERLRPTVTKAQSVLRPGEKFDSETGEIKPPASAIAARLVRSSRERTGPDTRPPSAGCTNSAKRSPKSSRCTGLGTRESCLGTRARPRPLGSIANNTTAGSNMSVIRSFRRYTRPERAAPFHQALWVLLQHAGAHPRPSAHGPIRSADMGGLGNRLQGFDDFRTGIGEWLQQDPLQPGSREVQPRVRRKNLRWVTGMENSTFASLIGARRRKQMADEQQYRRRAQRVNGTPGGAGVSCP